MTTLDLAHEFFDFGDTTFLNCATQGPIPRAAAAAVEDALELKKNPSRIRDSDYFELPDAYRREAAAILGCSAEDIALTDSATHGIMLLVGGLDWQEGDEVVVAAGEFPANRFPWLSLEAKGVKVREVAIPPGERGPAALEAALTDRTRVFATSWVSYSTGLRLDLGALGNLCRDREVLFAVDGSQGVGGLELDLGETRCDLLACAGYKWLLGPYGSGLAYVSPELGERLALGNVNWFAVRGARDFNRLSHCRLEMAPGARRFDVNETASFFNVPAATASLRLLRKVTVAAAEEHTRQLLDRVVAGLPPSFRVTSEQRPAHRSHLLYVAAATEEKTARAYRRLVEEKVIVAQREGSIRVSPFLYNTTGDIDRLLNVLNASAEAR